MNEIILAIDDNPFDLKLIRSILAKVGYVVRTAAGAEDALETLSSLTPDGVLMDVRMPGIDGLQLTRLLKLSQRTKAIPILAVSAHDTPEKIREAFMAGSSGYVVKPINTETFARTVQQCLSRSRRASRRRAASIGHESRGEAARWDYRGMGRLRGVRGGSERGGGDDSPSL